MKTLWRIKETFTALTMECDRCNNIQEALIVYVIESNKKKRKIICSKCLKYYPIVGLKTFKGKK